MNLYEINAEILSIMNQVDDDGILPDDAFDRLAQLGIVEADRVENLGLMVKNLSAEAEAIKTEADNLTKRRKTVENRVESIRAYLTDYLIMTGKKIQTPRLTMSLRPSTAVIVDDDAKLDEKYLIPQDPKISKTAIKDDLMAGIDIPGARIETRRNLQVR